MIKTFQKSILLDTFVNLNDTPMSIRIAELFLNALEGTRRLGEVVPDLRDIINNPWDDELEIELPEGMTQSEFNDTRIFMDFIRDQKIQLAAFLSMDDRDMEDLREETNLRLARHREMCKNTA